MASRSRKEGGGNVELSKALSWLLRHNAPNENVKVHPGGFVDVEAILQHRRFKKFTVEDIKNVVGTNDKQRFAFETDPSTGKLRIRANQGHSFQIDDLELDGIIDAANFPIVIHGTYLKYWGSIKTSGLSRMKRNHIHFAPGEPGDNGVISGMRKSVELYIYVDLQKALNDGLKFYRSENNVLLCPGNSNGYLESKYFTKVSNIKTGESLL